MPIRLLLAFLAGTSPRVPSDPIGGGSTPPMDPPLLTAPTQTSGVIV